MKAQRGFTIIELMVVVAIIGIILAIAIPGFQDQMRKSRRSEAVQNLSDLSLKQERFRSNNATYGASPAAIGGNATIPSGYYTFAISTPGGNCANGTAASNANSFTVTATAAGAQTADTGCATMSMTSLCGVVAKTSTGGGTCWK